jgi:hypothetical protein
MVFRLPLSCIKLLPLSDRFTDVFPEFESEGIAFQQVWTYDLRVHVAIKHGPFPGKRGFCNRIRQNGDPVGIIIYLNIRRIHYSVEESYLNSSLFVLSLLTA